jgi:micrococcal nuclease
MAKYTLGFLALFLFVANILAVMDFTLPQRSNALQPKSVAPVTEPQSCVVKVIYDGDTFGCDVDGDGKVTRGQEHIRMLGIDATEMHYSRKNKTGRNQPYALEAKKFLETAVLNRSVYLEYDKEHYDKYGRILAYVHRDPAKKQMLNRELLQKGLAKVVFIRINRRYEAEFNHLQEEAQSRHINLWQNLVS